MRELALHKFTKQLLEQTANKGVLYLHVPNGVQSRHGAKAGRWQAAMGARKGAADWLIVVHGRAKFLELKSETGRQSIWQRGFEQDAKAAGADYAIATSPEQVIAILTEWDAIKRAMIRLADAEAA